MRSYNILYHYFVCTMERKQEKKMKKSGRQPASQPLYVRQYLFIRSLFIRGDLRQWQFKIK